MKTTLLLTLLFALSTQAQDNTSLADEMESLQIPENQLPVGVEQERLYSVQDRHSSLKYRPEIGVNGGYNFTNNSYLRSFQGSVEGRFHLSNKFSVAAAYTWVSNEFSKDAKSLIDDKGVLPNVPYVMSKTHCTPQWLPFYS